MTIPFSSDARPILVRGAAFFLAVAGMLAPVQSQDWTPAQLRERTQRLAASGFLERVQAIAELLPDADRLARAANVLVTGTHRENAAQVEALIDRLGDDRWQVREDAERELVDVGAPALARIRERARNDPLLEIRIRAGRAADSIAATGLGAIEREQARMRGLLELCGYLPESAQLTAGLGTVLGHSDPSLVAAAARAIAQRTEPVEDSVVARLVTASVSEKAAAIFDLRRAIMVALARIGTPASSAAVAERVGSLDVSTCFAVAAALSDRSMSLDLFGDSLSENQLLRGVAESLAGFRREDASSQEVRIELRSGRGPAVLGEVAGSWFTGDAVVLNDVVAGLRRTVVPVDAIAELSLAEQEPATSVEEVPGQASVYLRHGSVLCGTLEDVGESVRLRSPVSGRTLEIARADVLAVVFARGHRHLSSPERGPQDVVVARSGEGETLHRLCGSVVSVRGSGAERSMMVRPATADTPEIPVPFAEIECVLLAGQSEKPRSRDKLTRVDTTGGDRMLGYVVATTSESMLFAVPHLGAVELPMASVARVRFDVSAGPAWGYTIIADHTGNRVSCIDEEGHPVFEAKEVFGPWDAEIVQSTGGMLVIEYPLSRVVEFDRDGEEVWSYEKLAGPMDADRLPNGNTLICNTNGAALLEVDGEGRTVWEYAPNSPRIKPLDAERLENGNTLFVDGSVDRLAEVNPAGEVVWELRSMRFVSDVDVLDDDRLLLTQRSVGRVLEVDRSGQVHWQIEGLTDPSDADRLPNGHTLVAEQGRVREFDRSGGVVWSHEAGWVLEVNRY